MSETQVLIDEYKLIIQSYIKESINSSIDEINLYRNKVDFLKAVVNTLLNSPIDENNSWIYNEIKVIIEEVNKIESESILSPMWNKLGLLIDYIYFMDNIRTRAG